MDMKTEKSLVAFEDHKIRRVYDEKAETWFFSVVDVVAALTKKVSMNFRICQILAFQ